LKSPIPDERRATMVKVSIEVRSGTARFNVAVSAESVQRALSLVGERHPGRIVRVKRLISGEDSSRGYSATLAGIAA
jgi:hypothetical protein